ncbi:PQQ-binding-like beta-propeller repeat protein, partial [Enterococcus faecalis]|uniref:outer membrane protein assembly factor BamB family protein n=1 Tax=Enterococcus faecalis TaxID=1351 RepID=UPI003D6A857F
MAATTVPARLRQLWQADLGGKITSPTVADGKVFVAMPEEGRIRALDADSGQPRWNFTTDARVDTPPTL